MEFVNGFPPAENEPAKDAILYAQAALVHCDNGNYEKAQAMATVALVYAILALR